jgi:predicted TIM-barrel fold metal-dependent hydrolase
VRPLLLHHSPPHPPPSSPSPTPIKAWHTDPAVEAVVSGLFLEAIGLFGVGRCMFASNFPVDKFMGVSAGVLYSRFAAWVSHLPPADVHALFHDNAKRVYGL